MEKINTKSDSDRPSRERHKNNDTARLESSECWVEKEGNIKKV